MPLTIIDTDILIDEGRGINIAGLILTTEAMIADVQEEKGDGGMGMGM